MAITYDGSAGTVTGVGADGIPSGIVTTATIASAAVTTAKMGFSAGMVVQTQVLNSATRASVAVGNTLVEASSSYRVTITPVYSNSVILVKYHVPISWGANWFQNSIARFTAKRWISGTVGDLSTIGPANGSRTQMTGFSFRSDNSFNGSDHSHACLTVYDAPGTTSAVSYGFYVSSEPTPTLLFGYSSDAGTGNSYDANIVIVAQEIKQ